MAWATAAKEKPHRTRHLALATLLVALASRASGQALAPWEAQPLLAEPKEVLKAAAAAAAGDEKADVVVLLEEARYRVQTEGGAQRWATIGTEWAPWYEERPELRARVVGPTGQAHLLDPRTIAEAGVSDDDPELFSDRKRLRAPLPGLKVGAVVEQEIRSLEKAPYFTAGSSFGFSLGSGVPVRRARVRVDAPESLPLHHALRGAEGLTVEKERVGGRVRLTLVAGPLPPLPEPEPGMASDRPRRPHFSFSTGASWASVAETYRRLVDAQIGVPAPAAARPGLKREEVAARLLKRLHDEVRYTGVEFGEAAVVPRPPAEVMSRRYGDCKDKSALLVSRLRSEGIPAYLALLRSGPGADVNPGLPGLGGFDHAIVVMPGPPTLWIDATDEFARVNELPLGVQDRLALIAAPGTSGLVRTPASQSTDNALRRTREYRLAESGPGSVVETTRTTGAVERAYRSYFARTDPAAVREQQEKYTKAEHGGGVVAFKNADPRDLSGPFEIRVESKDAGRAETEGSRAVVTIEPAGLFVRLPDYVGASPDDGGPKEPRREAFVLTEPHRVEWTYRIVPPPGFVAKRLPEAEKARLGGASLEVRFDTKPDGSVEGRLAFDSGPRSMEANAFGALHEGVKAWRARDPFRVEFEDKTQALVEEGRACEAISELRRAAERQPRKAGPRLRLAEALLSAGFGEAAREEARRALGLEPGSSAAHRTLGWVLEHDALGRRFKKGFDREGAEAAYRKAKELDPRSVLPRASLAILLEHNEEGVHFGEGAKLAEALREAQALRAELDNGSLDVNIMISLLKLRRFDELEAFARSLPGTPTRNEFLVAALGARRGARAAVLEAGKLFSDPGQRRDGLLHAGNSLLELRLYPEGAALVAESVAGAPDAAVRRARADLFARVKRHEEVKLPEGDPRSVVKRLLVLVAEHVSGKGDPSALLDIIVTTEDERRRLGRDPGVLRENVARVLRLSGLGDKPLSAVMVDLVVSLGEFVSEGDPDVGFRVRMKMGDRTQVAYVVWRDGRLKVLAGLPDPDLLAGEAWRLLDKGQVAGAARWLDWMREEFRVVSDDDPLAGPPFLALWRPAGDRSGGVARVAAASLFESPGRAAQGVQAIEAWRQAQTQPGVLRDLDRALLALSSRAGRTAEVLKTAERLHGAYPASAVAFVARVGALTDLGRGAEARALCEERLRRRPDDAQALRLLAQLHAREGRYEEAEWAFARLAGLGRAEAPDLNNRAWNAVLRGLVDDAALDWAQKAAQQEKTSASTLHTLAAVYAEKGRTREAHQVLVQSIESSAADEPSPHDWYVVGRLAEHCGLREVARGAYARVKDETGRADSTAVLARRAAARLGSPASAKRASR
jgi:tetratricopeptide (TPR) repeat protein